MGGYGSGCRLGGGKRLVNQASSIDVRQLARHGLLIPGRVVSRDCNANDRATASIRLEMRSDGLILQYHCNAKGGTPVRGRHFFPVEWTQCHFGGKRGWFICPSTPCSRRVAILYASGQDYLCRHCLQLAYPSQREAAADRAGRRANGIRRRLGWKAGIGNPQGDRPKGMHWSTYWRLTAKHDELAGQSLSEAASWLDQVRQQVARWRDDPESLPTW